MAVCNGSELEFPGCKNRKVQANFSGGNITSDGGVLLNSNYAPRIKKRKSLTGFFRTFFKKFKRPKNQLI
ncbi:MAG: hypothetical protein GY750_16205 [Lentisphaerae bacterium]|nr:hypothetical protein [Lentisphaerota bacterium]